jgi:predicted nucleotidyltransferase
MRGVLFRPLRFLVEDLIIPNMGTRKPNLRISKTSQSLGARNASRGLAAALFTTTQQRVLSLLFGQPERTFGKTELIRLAGGGSGAVQREVLRLVSAGLVNEESHQGRTSVQANAQAPLFAELCSIVDKTSGITAQVREALEPLSARIRFATMFGSVAKQSEHAGSDVDVLVVSDDLLLEDLFRAFAHVEEKLGRSLNPTLYTSEEFERRRHAQNPFLVKVLAGKHRILMGAIDGDFTAGQPGEDRSVERRASKPK